MENLAEEQRTPVEQQKKLFIGGLNPTTTDDQLKEYCSKFGEIVECSIIRDKTGRSRSFAFVCFQELSSVDEFMKQRPHVIDGRKSEVRRAMPRSETSKFDTVSTVNKIFVGAIPTDLAEDELRSHFQTFGNVVECHIMKDKEEKSRGFGFVTYDDYDAVDRCILEKPHLIHGKKVDVQKAIPRDQFQRTHHSLPRPVNFRPVDYALTTQPILFNYPTVQGQFAPEFSKPMPLMNSNNSMNPTANFISNFNYYPPHALYMAPIDPVPSNRIPKANRTSNRPRNSSSSGSSSSNAEHNRKLFIGGLSAKTTDETLKDYVIKFGELSDCLVMKDQNGHSKCFGFVTFTNSDSLDEFMKNRPHLIDGRQVDPKRAMPREEAQNNDIHLTVKKIFLGGLRDGLNEETLRNYFQQFGNITDCLMMQDHEGNLRGFAFIEFDDYDSVDKVILARPHTIGEHKIDVKKAIPKENRSQTYQNHLNGFDLASNNCYYPFNPLFPSGFYSPSVPLLTPYGASHLNENFSHLHLSNISTSNIRGQAPRNSQ